MKKRKFYDVEHINNMRELLNNTVDKYPQNIAYKFKKYRGKNKFEYVNKTYSEFKYDVEGLSTKLLNMGLEGKKIAVIGNNRYEWCTTYLAVTTGNMIIVPLDKALPENELESLLHRSEAEVVFCDGKYVEKIKKVKEQEESRLKYIVSFDETEENEILIYNEILEQGKKERLSGNTKYDEIKIDEEKMSILLFTSGTTSTSKGVMLSQKNICSNIEDIASVVKMYPTDTLLSFLPIHHTFECTITFLYGIYYGVTVAFCDGIKYIQKNMNEYKVTVFVAVPLVLENIYRKVWKGIDEKGKTKVMKTMVAITRGLAKIKIDLRKKVFKPVIDQFGGKLRVVFYGAAPMDKKTILGFNDFGVELIQGYGLTETSPVVTAETDREKRPGSIGLPLPNVEVKIYNPDEEGNGEILVKGPNVMLGYNKNEEETKKSLKNGWFYTGDYGYIDKDGFVFMSGRKKDVIVLKNGKNIYPQELEFLINKLPYVEESMVFSRDRNSMDTMLCAKIVYNKDSAKDLFETEDVSKLKEFIWKDIKEINKKLPDVKHIKDIIITEEPLIKTTTQKVKRYEEIKKIN
mgnify:CR=1 FL=1